MAAVDDHLDLHNLGDEASHIRRLPFKVTTSILFALALLVTTLHFYVRLRQKVALHFYDCIHLFSILCLVGAIIPTHLRLSDMYLMNALSTNPGLLAAFPAPLTSHLVDKTLKYGKASHVLMWTAIFGVKITLLVFFKQSVNTMALACTRVKRCWYGTLVSMVVGWAFIISIPFMICPHRGEQAVTHCIGTNKGGRARAIIPLGTTIDCITYLLVLPFPFLTLYHHGRTPTTLRQKSALATVTCLYTGTITASIIRSVHPHDTPFQAYLTLLECTIATLTLPIPSLQNLFEPQGHQIRSPKTHHSWIAGTLTRKRTPSSSSEQLHYPDTMLAGLQTFVEGNTTKALPAPPSLERNESVLRTREVVIEVSYEKDLERGDWDRLASPSWMAEAWKRSSRDTISSTL